MEKALPICSKIKSCVDNLKTLNDDSSTSDVKDYVCLKLMSSKMPPTIITFQLKPKKRRKLIINQALPDRKRLSFYMSRISEIITKIKLRQDEHLAKGFTCHSLARLLRC